MTRVRWMMLSLLFLGTTLNYLDRIVFSFLAHDIRADIHFDNEMYGRITSAFGFAYMAGYIVMGKFMDRVGTRAGYAIVMAWWSLAAALHAVAHSAFSLAFWRAMLGLGESGNFPAAIKSVAEWFPKRERAFATGIFNAGTNVASMFGPFLIAFLTVRYGWRACFIITAVGGFLLMVIWLLLYRTPESHASVSKAELEHIRSDADEQTEENEPKLSWKAAASLKQTWGFSIAKFLTDPVWWFYLWWLPLYLADVHKLTIDEIRWPILLVYGIADVGSVLFGWIPGFLNRHGWEMGRARKSAMAMCAVLMPISSLAVFADNVWVAVGLVSVATACHQGWSANLFTTTSDVFPKRVVGSVVGIGGCIGGLGSALFASLVPGIIIQHFGYTPAFLAMGCLHLTALLVVHKLMGGLKPVTLAPAGPAQGA